MRLASKGLGKMTLPFRLSEADVVLEDGELMFQGVIKERTVNWPYRAQLQESDIVGFVVLARRPEVVRFVAEQIGLRLVGALLGATLQLLAHPFRRQRAQEESKS